MATRNFCSSCGTRLETGSAFCENCGAAVPTVEIPCSSQVASSTQISSQHSVSSTTTFSNDIKPERDHYKTIWVSTIAAGLLISGWFFMNAVSLNLPLGSIHYTFWHLLSVLNAENAFESILGNSNTGIYGILAIISIAGPFARYISTKKVALLGGFFPLLFMLVVGIVAFNRFQAASDAAKNADAKIAGALSQYADSMSSIGQNQGSDAVIALRNQARDVPPIAVSLGFGFYLSALTSICFGGLSVMGFSGRHSGTNQDTFEREWYTQTWLVVALIIVVFPLGLFLLWRSPHFRKSVKVAVSVVSILLGIIWLVNYQITGQKSPLAGMLPWEYPPTNDKPDNSHRRDLFQESYESLMRNHDNMASRNLLMQFCDGGEFTACSMIASDNTDRSSYTTDYFKDKSDQETACMHGSLSNCALLGRFPNGIRQTPEVYASINFITSACNAGNVVSCAKLGLLYENGNGVKEDDTRAAGLYLKACDAGISSACSYLGVLYLNGKGVAPDSPRAALLFTKAYKGGDFEGYAKMGWMYERGLGVDKSESQAVAYYSKACDAGITYACGDLGVLYRDGKGVSSDDVKASKLMTLACSSHNYDCSKIGWMYEKGQGVIQDAERARKLYDLSCHDGNQWSCERLKHL